MNSFAIIIKNPTFAFAMEMKDPIDITEILKEGESGMTEFKASFNVEAMESLAAFANTKGGQVLVGVSNNGKVTGVQLSAESVQHWLNEIKGKTQPSVIPDTKEFILEGKTVVSLSVKEYPVKPIAFMGKYFKRLKNSNHQMSPSEISSMYLQTMQYSWDSYQAIGHTLDDLDEEAIIKFINKVNDAGRFVLDKGDWKESLTKLRLLREGLPTNAAYLLFGKGNVGYNVHLGRFKTPSVIVDDRIYSGNLFDVVEQSMSYLVGQIRWAYEITGESTRRTEIPEYPLEALREVLLNAIVHRDYQSPTDVQIKIFDNSIRFFNPSGLYGNITIEELHTDSYSASTRNKLIAEAFYLTGAIEKYGSGFIRVRKAIESYPTMKFTYCDDFGGFTSEFSYTERNTGSGGGQKVARKWPEKWPETKRQIIAAIESDANITISLLEQKTSKGHTIIKKYLGQLQDEGFLRRIGGDRGGHWEIIK